MMRPLKQINYRTNCFCVEMPLVAKDVKKKITNIMFIICICCRVLTWPM